MYVEEKCKLEKIINSAIENRKLHLYSQPIILISSRERSTEESSIYELLLRLENNQGEIIPASNFIEKISCNSELIRKVDRWAIKEALKLATQSSSCYHINLNPNSLLEESFLDFVLDSLKDNKVAANRINFEITERIKTSDRAARKILLLQEAGFGVGIDDFLTGYNSFSLFNVFKPDFIKIPGEIVKTIEKDYSFLFTKLILQFSEKMGINAIAEHIEEEKTYFIFKELSNQYSCKIYGQGYFFARPFSCRNTE